MISQNSLHQVTLKQRMQISRSDFQALGRLRRARPNTVQKIVSRGGLGLEMLTIVTKAMPLKTPIPESDINDFFTEENLRDFVPKGSLFLAFTKTKIEETPAVIYEFITDSSRAGIDFYLHQKVLCFFQGNTFIQVACSVGVDKTDEGATLVRKRADSFSTLFTLIFNSIVFENKYRS